MDIEQVIILLKQWNKKNEYGNFKIIKNGKNFIDIETTNRIRIEEKDKYHKG